MDNELLNIDKEKLECVISLSKANLKMPHIVRNLNDLDASIRSNNSKIDKLVKRNNYLNNARLENLRILNTNRFNYLLGCCKNELDIRARLKSIKLHIKCLKKNVSEGYVGKEALNLINEYVKKRKALNLELKKYWEQRPF